MFYVCDGCEQACDTISSLDLITKESQDAKVQSRIIL